MTLAMTTADAAHLHRRAGFGGPAAEVVSIAGSDRAPAGERLLNAAPLPEAPAPVFADIPKGDREYLGRRSPSRLGQPELRPGVPVSNLVMVKLSGEGLIQLHNPAGRAHVVAGVGGVPGETVHAVLLDMTVTEPLAVGELCVWATGTEKPDVAMVSDVQGQTVANLVVAPVGANGHPPGRRRHQLAPVAQGVPVQEQSATPSRGPPG